MHSLERNTTAARPAGTSATSADRLSLAGGDPFLSQRLQRLLVAALLLRPERAEGILIGRFRPQQVTADLRAMVAGDETGADPSPRQCAQPRAAGRAGRGPARGALVRFRPITPRLADTGFCLKLRDSGCVMLKLGLEPGDPAVLAALNKGIDLPTAAAALKNPEGGGDSNLRLPFFFERPRRRPRRLGGRSPFTAEHAEEIGFLNLAIFNLRFRDRTGEASIPGEFYDGDLSLYRPFYIRGVGAGGGQAFSGAGV